MTPNGRTAFGSPSDLGGEPSLRAASQVRAGFTTRISADPMRLFVVLVFSAFVSAHLLPIIETFPNGIIDDDAYFYAQIAYNLAYQSASTFDGISQTSGYHLLWAWLLSTVSLAVSIVSDDKSVHIFAYTLVSIGIASAISFYVFERNVERLCAFVMFFLASLTMETILLSGLFLILFSRFLDDDDALGNRVSDLLIVFLVPLTRVDAATVIGVVVLYFLFTRQKNFWKLAVALAMGLAVHFLTMKVVFGEFYSVSSMLKLTRTGIFEQEVVYAVKNIVDSKAQLVRFFAVVVLVFLSAWNIRSTVDRESMIRKTVVLCAMLAYFMPFFFLTTMRSWYFLPFHLVLLYLATRRDIVGGRVATRQAATALFSIALSLAYIAGAFLYHHKYRNDQINSASFVKDLRAFTGPDDRIFQIDGTGYVGYFSRRHLINGDGLMNSYDFARRLGSRALATYLSDMQVCYIITTRRAQTGEFLVDHFGLRVRQNEVERLTGVPDDGRNKQLKYTLYRLTTPRCRTT